MNQRDLAEIKRRLNPTKRNATVLRGRYVTDTGEIISSFAKRVGSLPQEENEKYMAIFKRGLSGTFGQNLHHVELNCTVDALGEEQQILLNMADSGLTDEEAVEALYERATEFIRRNTEEKIQSVEERQAAGNYLILLIHDGYDVPMRDNNDEIDHEQSNLIFRYIMCCICPVKQGKPALCYDAADGDFHNRLADWVVGMPEMGFLYPAYEEGGSNIYRALYYTKDAGDFHNGFLRQVFGTELGMTAAEQQHTFQSIMQETLAEECGMDIAQAVHETMCVMLEERKADKHAEPLVLGAEDMKNVLVDCGVSEEKADNFAAKYDESFGEHAALPAVNMVAPKQFRVDTPSVSIRVDPERRDLIETRQIDGKYYILVLADGDVEVNGMKISI